jgi:hypothetical protein
MRIALWCQTSAALAFAAGLAACSPAPADEADGAAGSDSAILAEGPEAVITELAAGDIPEGARAAALEAVPGMSFTGAERKERDGMVFYDVEGTRADGSEVELDMLVEDGVFRVVEIQRDLAWADVPAPARAAAEAAPDMFAPVRVIESVQEDGAVIYELFRERQPGEPAAEVKLADGKAEMLTERWAY